MSDAPYSLTKQQLQNYWESKFGEVWVSKCECCLLIPIFPYSVFVHYDIVPNQYVPVTEIQLCCEGCVKGRIYQKRSNTTRLHVWLAYFGPTYTEKCFCCHKNTLKYFDSWHKAHFVARSKGGSDQTSNLRPVCAQCNLTMGSLSIESFQSQNHFKENIFLLPKDQQQNMKTVQLEILKAQHNVETQRAIQHLEDVKSKHVVEVDAMYKLFVENNKSKASEPKCFYHLCTNDHKPNSKFCSDKCGNDHNKFDIKRKRQLNRPILCKFCKLNPRRLGSFCGLECKKNSKKRSNRKSINDIRNAQRIQKEHLMYI
jgi:hypothetical protein